MLHPFFIWFKIILSLSLKLFDENELLKSPRLLPLKWNIRNFQKLIQHILHYTKSYSLKIHVLANFNFVVLPKNTLSCSFKCFETSDVIVVKKKLICFCYSYVLTRAKKDEIVSCGAPGCTNKTDKNSNSYVIKTMSSKMMRDTINPGIVRTVYSGIFIHIQGH